ncbi:UvrD-helicase domain-containing protein [Candidatus Nanosalina sp. VS9-1]|uniref:UvrD-helicase domain-containing protein n=1 Tax=Candidatus Nanosalina sp. VS9-1 TaxID=3388566 RepID=UPI0039E0D557
MSEFAPNDQQQKIIDRTEGVILADAGAGTGKTFTVTHRYVKLLEKGVEPEDIFLATYTRNAAEEMTERIMKEADVEESRIFEAPISTFHSHCQDVLERHGFDAPSMIGLDRNITEETQVMESAIRERQEFDEFYRGFREDHSEYRDFYHIVSDSSELLSLLKSLASKGIVPTREAWFRDTGRHLDGDWKRFRKIFQDENSPREGSRGKKQSRLRARLSGFDRKTYLDDAPEKEELRGDRGTKSVRRDFCRKAFEEDREELKNFVHDLFIGYIDFCLSRNYLNFSFLMMFTYVLMHEDENVRKDESFDYMMIDEFQDTNEIQFKLALLMASEPNICVVGDWKQSIYSFQYAEVENIQDFQERLERFREELNRGRERVGFQIGTVEKIPLEKNYRSSQDILDFSEDTLELPGSRWENVAEVDVTSLESEKGLQDSTIRKIISEDEVEAVITSIQEIVDNPEYTCEGEGGERPLEFDDIAVLTRTRSLGLELQEKAREYGVPAAYEAGIELFKTDPSIILLAWLRILNSDSRRGWAVVLEEAGYTLDEADKILDEKEYPKDMREFREEIASEESVTAVAEKVFNRYGMQGAASGKIIEVLNNTFISSYMNTGRIINFIEENIEEGETYEVDFSESRSTVKIQTVHKAKGLEYPAVFIAGLNRGVFPSYQGSRASIDYVEPAGIRQRKIFDDSDMAFNYDNWRYEIISRCITGTYDEERRLLYVATTRAENHLFMSAEKGRASRFYEEIDLEPVEVEPEIKEVESEEDDRPVLEVDEPEEKRPSVASVTDTTTRGDPEDGLKIHRFAERYAQGENVEASTKGEKEVKEIIDSLDGELVPEVSISNPDGDTVYRAQIDLINIEDDRVDVIDWKTGEEKEKHRAQIEKYREAIKQKFPEKKVQARLEYITKE